MKKVIIILMVLVVCAGFAFAGEKARDSRFIAYDNETVLDTQTNLMWAAKDNGSDVDWVTAKTYCENYRGGGYTDWRMPTQSELAGLYNDARLTELIHVANSIVWASDTSASNAAFFNFIDGTMDWDIPHRPSFHALPVRFGK